MWAVESDPRFESSTQLGQKLTQAGVHTIRGLQIDHMPGSLYEVKARTWYGCCDGLAVFPWCGLVMLSGNDQCGLFIAANSSKILAAHIAW